MAYPKSLVFQLHKHWDAVETLVRASREVPAFSIDQALLVIAKAAPNVTPEVRENTLQSLVNADILQPLPRSNDLQINSLVLEFVRGLTREHELGLSSVLQARVEGIRSSTTSLNHGLEGGDTDLIRTGAAKLSDLLRQIRQQLEQDRHAIMELAEQAKSAESDMPLKRRYRRVLEAYDQYIEPMNQLMDSGPSGTFYRYLEAAESSLDIAFDYFNTQGALYLHRLQLKQVAYQAKELRRTGRLVAQHCADTLLPLRDELRQNNSLSTSISWHLGEVRKKDLKRAFRKAKAGSGLPIWQHERIRRVSIGDEVLSIMAQAQLFTPFAYAFPDEIESESSAAAEWIDEDDLNRKLLAALPIENLLEWLNQQYQSVSDATLLRLYHELVRESAWCSYQSEHEGCTELNDIGVHYFPHRLNQS